MALHELCTNAVKYGALSNDSGRVDIDWRLVHKDGWSSMQLEWRERGGPPVTPPAKRGFGSRMIERALPSELGGKVELHFDAEGLRCLVEAPVPNEG
jgi:two-component sensor histidine kinase